ncbi:zona pellucida glycoprotein 1 [Turdus rufiventris]|nr:zona pellucida glycoprotein 1 [Turdus rufiventris]
MGQSCSFLLLLFLLSLWPRATVALLKYRYECGELGMQLLVLPPHGRSVRFKVLDEFGSRFDVANCSICLHWLNSRDDGSITFSSGYKGCHVLFKENRYVLRVQLEELLSSGIPVTSYEVNMTCPKSGGSEVLPDGKRERGRDNGVLFSHTGLHQVSESSLTLMGSHFTSQDHLEQVHTVGHYEPSSVLPGIPHHSNPAHSGLSQPGYIRPGLQSEPDLGRPGLQPQPGLLRPGIHPQPSLVESTALFYPSAGAGMQLTREQCQVPVGRMPCVAPQGREGCMQAGCCYDDMDRITPCYYGNTATVQCLLEGYFVLVVPRGMVTAPYNPDSVRLASSQAGCEPLRTSEAFVMFRFPVTHCGTTVQVIEDKLIYENQLISTIDVQGSPRGSITRDSVYVLHARCIYNSSDLLPLGVEVAAPPTVASVVMPGPLGLQLRIATDESYSSYHPVGDFPLVRVLRDPIYVEVRLLQKTDPNLVLVLHHCWASPGSHATSQPQWPILVDGCPFQGDNYRTRLIPMGPASPELPFPSHYQRFVISTFTFVEPPGMAVLEGEVYISCSASVCHLAQPEPCRPSCQLGVPSRESGSFQRLGETKEIGETGAPYSQANLLLPTGARRSLGDRKTGDGMGTVSSQGCIVFPEVPKRGETQQRG